MIPPVIPAVITLRERSRGVRDWLGMSAQRPAGLSWIGYAWSRESLPVSEHLCGPPTSGVLLKMVDRIAFFTFGVLKSPVGDSEVQGFVDRLADVYAVAEGTTGFFERSIRNVETWEHSWGPVVAPKCTPDGVGLTQLAMTLSLWQDLDSVAAFAYRGAHGEALSKRADWFRKGAWPSYVAWWVDEHHRPNWNEAVARIDRLHVHGSTPEAFTFRKPFDPSGVLTRVKWQRPAS